MQEHVLNMAIAIIMDCNLVPADMGQKSNYDLLLGGRPRPSRKRGGRNQKLRPRHKTRDKAMRCVQLCFSFNIHKDKDKDGDNNKDKDKTRDKAMPCVQLCFSLNIHKDKGKDGDNNKDKDKTRGHAM